MPTEEAFIRVHLNIFSGSLPWGYFRGFVTPNTIISIFSNPLQFFIHVLLPDFLLYLYIFPFPDIPPMQCTVNNYKPTPFLFQAQPPILIIRVEGWLDHWPLLVIPTTIWAEVHLLPEIKVPITVRLVSKEDQDAVRLWPLLQGTVYEFWLEV